MTREEAIILSAYTGYLLTKNFSDVQDYISELLDRPVFTHELVDEKVLKEIRDKVKPLVMKIIENET